MDFLIAPIVVGTITYGIYKLFELFVCRRERLNIIEKLSNGITLPSTDKIRLDGYFGQRSSFGALKAGCLLVGVGLGLLIGFIIASNYIPDYFNNTDNWQIRQMTGLIYGSCILLFGGIGLIAAFMIELRLKKQDKAE